jgi:hypothetical protein
MERGLSAPDTVDPDNNADQNAYTSDPLSECQKHINPKHLTIIRLSNDMTTSLLRK